MAGVGWAGAVWRGFCTSALRAGEKVLDVGFFWEEVGTLPLKCQLKATPGTSLD